MTAPVAVLGIGNRSRGDDALGPLLLDRLRVEVGNEGAGSAVECLEAYQLQVEDALDLEGRRLALFVDAVRGGPAPVVFRAVAACDTLAACASHALGPEAVLRVHAEVGTGPAPAAFVLAVRGERFGLGEPLSPAACAAFEEAWQLLDRLVRCPETGYWQSVASACNQKEGPMATRKPASKEARKETPEPARVEGAKAKRVSKGATKVVAAAVAGDPGGAASRAAAPGPCVAAERQAMVAVAAYFRAERRGFAPGGEHQDWLEAEIEIERLFAR